MRLAIVAVTAATVFQPLAAQVPTAVPSAAELDERRTTAQQSLWGRRQNAFLPFGTQEEAAAFWGQGGAQFLSSGTLLFNDDAFESTLELVSDVVGIFRVGIGVTVAAARGEATDSASAEAAAAEATLSRVANSGGVFLVNAALPLLYLTQREFNSTWAVMWTSASAIEAPKAGGFLENPALSIQSGLELLYERRGVGGDINFHAGVIARGYWLNNAFGEKAAVSDGLGFLFVPRVGLTLLGQTRIDLHYRAARTSDFDDLASVGITVQQVTN